MDASLAVMVLVGLVVVASVIGVVLQRTNGRLKTSRAPGGASAGAADLHLLGAGVEPGDSATIILFSTEFCARCPATKRMLDQLASTAPGVVVAEVDLTDRQDLARSYDVRQTPTVLVLDADGKRVARIGGPPRRAELEAQLLQLSS
ncbi:thioredoxin [Pseudoclavibacter sp. RFBJ3]|uniref:thioredoxin family protein n=1 Tax=unclassified Pseudoclavibacter TaxID=2615177 RepID=UPI000CE8BF81|nr:MULTISPECIES: thioredoxin family protein [unclassified Pseudoclavibacter]PPF84200.1 thioredoxin [Pseudoclavibacter sp. RFBJ5]PPF92899.1 thioredoxin [Pseudoclavibacter sp. RFBJ3]PPF98028.1 thioredoxin [Pseudoclavibacter sp. RFBH5]PPG25098.1 thioredoxin [Pseudoclavibacter sp. RFBI4]